MEPLGNSGSQNPESLQILLLLTSSQKKTNMKWTCKGHIYERPGRQRHSFSMHLLVLMPAGIAAKLQPII